MFVDEQSHRLQLLFIPPQESSWLDWVSFFLGFGGVAYTSSWYYTQSQPDQKGIAQWHSKLIQHLKQKPHSKSAISRYLQSHHAMPTKMAFFRSKSIKIHTAFLDYHQIPKYKWGHEVQQFQVHSMNLWFKT